MAEQKKNENQTHVSIVICGHVDAGKSTTTGRLIFELGGIDERSMQKLRDEAKVMGKESFAFAFYMDKNKDERARGVTIACTTKEFFTKKFHYTIIDAPGHRDFIKNMISGASQADVALLMVPADGNFTAAIAKGNHKAGEVQGQTRQHARLVNLLGVKQIIIGINKMDTKIAGPYGLARFTEIKDEMQNMLRKIGYQKARVEECIPCLPLSGFEGDNLITKSANMAWWKGVDIKVDAKSKDTIHIDTLYDALDGLVQAPDRTAKGDMRTPISGVYKIKGVGDVLTGRVEQGRVEPNQEVKFMPTHTAATTCTGKVFTVEMHHHTVPFAGTGDNVGMNIKALNKDNMPQVGDIMIHKADMTINRNKDFTAQVQILDHPGQLKVGYTPIAYVRTARSAVKMVKINWKIGKSTGKAKMEDPVFVKANEMAECVFEPQQPFVVDSFKKCEGLGRVAIMEGNSLVMLGKITTCNFVA